MASDASLLPGEAAALDYPYKDVPVPAPGEAREVGPGVFWLRMPMPSRLNHINVWLIEEDGGWTVVDTGIPDERTREVWRTVFQSAMGRKPLRRVIVTHLHPDHVGLAGWLCEHFDVELWMSRTDYLLCRTLVQDTGRDAPPEGLRFYTAAGFTEAGLKDYREKFGRFGAAVFRMPQAYRRIVDGETLRIGGQDWRVVVGRGHAPEHACLWCPALNLFISGDQILPRISSNVSVFPTEPDANPLQEWLDSCARLKALLPADVLVLPAHNEPFYGAHARLVELQRDHELGLSKLLDLCREPKRAVDVFGPLFKSVITEANFLMATGESLAHLNCLMARGLVTRTNDPNGVAWYQAA